MEVDGLEVTADQLRAMEDLQWQALEVEREAGIITVEQEDLMFFYWFREHHQQLET